MEFMLFVENFKLLLLQCIANIVLSGLSLKYINTEKKTDDTDPTPNDNENENKPLIVQEIEKLKQELELKELKEEYLSLYKKLHKDDKKEQ